MDCEYSPYDIVVKQYVIVSKTNFKCSPTLGVNNYTSTARLGSSASGMILAKGDSHNIPVFVKIFAMSSNWISYERQGRKIYKKKVVVDNNFLEIGLTRFLSDILLSEFPITQNLVAVYGYGKCNNGFETIDNISRNTGQIIHPDFETDEDYVVKIGMNLPQNNLMSNYTYGNFDDKICYLIVSAESGDIEKLLISTVDNYVNKIVSKNEFESKWNSIFFQIILTFYTLDDMLGGFYHGDCGPRNILYKFTDFYGESYFQYNILGNTYYVENMGIIAKLWDFSYMHISEKMKNEFNIHKYFDYIRDDDIVDNIFDQKISSINQLCTQIVAMKEFELIKHLPTFQKIKYISELEADDYQTYINLFNNFTPTQNHKLLQPVFNY